MAAVEEKAKGLPQLDKGERLELQNIMLKMALEQERIMRFEAQISTARKEIKYQESRMQIWQASFGGKLKASGTNLTIEQINIDAETGVVSVSNVEDLPER